MLITQISSKGQIVLPKVIRNQLGIEAGTRFQVKTDDERIILTPIKKTIREGLYGKYRGESLIEELEVDHAREIRRENIRS